MEDWEVLSSLERERDIAFIAAHFWAGTMGLRPEDMTNAVNAALAIYKEVLEHSKRVNE